MAEIDSLMRQVVHLSRLGLAGRRQDVQMIVRRIARQSKASFPDVSRDLSDLLRDAPSPTSPLRSKTTAAIPVDRDTRLGLVRVEHPVLLDVDPVWTPKIKTQLEQVIAEQMASDELDRAGLFPTRSLLFTGKPGVGKTLAARWLANQMNLPLFVLDLSAVMSSFLGRTGSNIRNVFDYAKGSKCVLLLDELDAIAKRRDDLTEIGELKRLVTVILQEVDDWPAGSLLIAATNHSELLDPAVWRRFEMLLEFPIPDFEHTCTAVEKLLGDSAEELADLVHPISLALSGTSFSDIEREISQMRREAIVGGTPLKNAVLLWMSHHSTTLPRAQRIALAVNLVKAGWSQRAVGQLTGVSRDTIRKQLTASKKHSGRKV